MAVTHVASATYTSTTGTSGGTITIPASVLTGDDLYVATCQRNVTTPNPTCVDNDVGGNVWSQVGVTADSRVFLFWKKATASTASKTITVSCDASASATSGGMSAFRGAQTGDPTTNFKAETNASGDQTSAGITPTAADSMICFVIGSIAPAGLDWNNAVVTSLTSASLGAMQPELWSTFSTAGSDCYIIFAAVLESGSAATGNFTWNQVAASSTRTMAFAVRPMGVVAPSDPQWSHSVGTRAPRVFDLRSKPAHLDTGHALSDDPAVDTSEG